MSPRMHSSRDVGFASLVTVAIAFGFLALARPAEALIYFGDQREINRSTFDGGSVEEDFLDFQPAGANTVLAADGEYIYWGDHVDGSHTIGRAEVDGANIDRTFIENIPCCFGVTDLEVGGGRIFWLAGDHPYIGRANADGSGVENEWRATRLNDSGSGVSRIALTPTGGALFADGTYFQEDPIGDLYQHRGIFSINPSSGAATLIAGLGVVDLPNGGIAANATHVYFAQCHRTDDGLVGGVGRVPVEGGTVDMNFFVPDVEKVGGYCNGVSSVDAADASRIYINWGVQVCAPGGFDCQTTTNISTLGIESKTVTHVIPNRFGGIAVDALATFPRPLIARSISLKYKKNDKMVGSVSSDKPFCERGVTVRLYRKGSSRARKDKTDSGGKYVIKNVTSRGKYRAEARVDEEIAGVCLEAKSALVRVGK